MKTVGLLRVISVLVELFLLNLIGCEITHFAVKQGHIGLALLIWALIPMATALKLWQLRLKENERR